MKRLYSKSTQTTYLKGMHVNIPDDAVEISEELYTSVIANPPPGMVRAHDANGLPYLVEAPARVTIVDAAAVEALRLHAYSDPLTGSDRFFAEAQRMQAMGESDWESVRAAGITRFEEIQRQYPWPLLEADL